MKPDALPRARLAIAAERARRDAHWFCFESGAVLTKDEHDLTRPIKPLPETPYLRTLLDCLLVSGRLLSPARATHALAWGLSLLLLEEMGHSGICFIEKSRQMLVTWLLCAYARWRAGALPHQLLLVQSKKEEDAANLVFIKEPGVARISFIEHHLPGHLRCLTWPRSAAFGRLYFPNGSQIWAIPEGGEIIRSNTASVVLADEAAYQPAFGESYTAALPAVKGGGQYIAVSSAAPGEFEALVSAEMAA